MHTVLSQCPWRGASSKCVSFILKTFFCHRPHSIPHKGQNEAARRTTENFLALEGLLHAYIHAHVCTSQNTYEGAYTYAGPRAARMAMLPVNRAPSLITKHKNTHKIYSLSSNSTLVLIQRR
jgi:hypothetical protein